MSCVPPIHLTLPAVSSLRAVCITSGTATGWATIPSPTPHSLALTDRGHLPTSSLLGKAIPSWSCKTKVTVAMMTLKGRVNPRHLCPQLLFYTNMGSDTFSQHFACSHLDLLYCPTRCLPHPHRATGELTSHPSGILTMKPAASPQLNAPSMQFCRTVCKLFTLHPCTEPCHAIDVGCSRSQARSCSDWQAGCEPWASQPVWVTVHIVNHQDTRW